VFLTMIVVGLVGLLMMALPALGGHHLPPAHGSGHGHGSSIGAQTHGQVHGPGPAHGHVAINARTMLRFLPSPRVAFSLCALYGAFGNALVHAGHLGEPGAALIAIVPAFLVERLLIRPVWNLLFRFRADASSPLEQLIFSEAQAVVPFRNGRGMIATVRDGRRVQLHARLTEQHATLPVKFGQRLRIEDVDARRERVTVSVVSTDPTTHQPT
jgi:hypothetical protein